MIQANHLQLDTPRMHHHYSKYDFEDGIHLIYFKALFLHLYSGSNENHEKPVRIGSLQSKIFSQDILIIKERGCISDSAYYFITNTVFV
jgi:hypothetical protein